MITDEAIKEAWDRVARTADGAVIYAHLQKVAIGILGIVDPSDGALRANHGERSFAHRLMGLMARGIDESGGRNSTDDTGARRSERPLVFAVRPVTDIPRKSSIAEWRKSAELAERNAVPGGGASTGGSGPASSRPARRRG